MKIFIAKIIGALFIIIALSSALHIPFSTIPDLDSLYHFRHAALYTTRGLFDSSFPWTEFSVIRETGGDLWYGFHILLIPLTYFHDPVFALRLGGILSTAAFLFLIYGALAILGARWPLFWTVLLLFSSPDFLVRATALRPQTLSLGLILLLFSFLFYPASHISVLKKMRIHLFVSSFLIAWIHIALAWIPILLFCVAYGIKKIYREHIYVVQQGIAILGGIFLGWIARPRPWGTLHLAYIQLIQLFIEKWHKTPLLFGTELLHFTGANFIDQFLPATALWTISLFLFFTLRARAEKNQKIFPLYTQTLYITSLLLAGLFFWLSFNSARRSADFFFALTYINIALTATYYFRIEHVKTYVRNGIIALLLGLGIWATSMSLIRYIHLMNSGAYSPYTAQAAGQWLSTHTTENDIVFHTSWDQFAPLFFWDTHNHYINGMDPIFEYTYNPALYWKQHFFAIDRATNTTCGAIRCTQDMVEDSYAVLTKDFHARYIYIQKKRNPNLLHYLTTDTRYKNVFENDDDMIFQITR